MYTFLMYFQIKVDFLIQDSLESNHLFFKISTVKFWKENLFTQSDYAR